MIMAEETAQAQTVQAQVPAQAAAQAGQAAQAGAAKKAIQRRAPAGTGAARKRPAKKKEVTVATSKRKEAVARAYVRKGTGIVTVNNFDVSTTEPAELRRLMTESLHISNVTEDVAKGVDINVNVRGGGQSGQAQAVRSAIAKGISDYADSDAVRRECIRFDRYMIIDDTRRVEPKKFKGPKARARFQKSYR